MSGYHLCHVKKAEHPYYIESIGIHIYTIEELCFYIKQNIYLIDKTFINEELCNWVRDELELDKLYRKLYEKLKRQEVGSISEFLMPVFKEIEYLTPEEYHRIQDQISKVEIQPEDLRRKMKADYLVKYEMYGNAIQEYYQILKERNPGNLGIQFYAAVLNNMAAAYGKLFLFEEAADCLWQSYGIVPSTEVWNRYLSTLPLFMNKEEYRARVEELSVPEEQIRRLESKSADYITTEVPKKLKEVDLQAFLKEKKEKYYKSVCS